jgi:hypothetical protein
MYVTNCVLSGISPGTLLSIATGVSEGCAEGEAVEGDEGLVRIGDFAHDVAKTMAAKSKTRRIRRSYGASDERSMRGEGGPRKARSRLPG